MRCIIRTVPWVQRRYLCAQGLARRLHGELVESRGEPALETMLRALETQGEDGAWHLEDDIRLTSNWEAKATEQQRLASGAVIQGFDGCLRQMAASGWSDTPPDTSVKGDWPAARPFLGGQCFYIPAGMAPRILELGRWWRPSPQDPLLVQDEGYQQAEDKERWYLENCPEHPIRGYLLHIDSPYWVVVPALVQHRRTPTALPIQRVWYESTTFTP